MQLEKIEINLLQPAEYNPRQINTKQYNDLKKSVVKFGCVDPIIVNEYYVDNKYIVIGGHQRLKILQELNYTHAPCIILNLNKQDEKELNIRLNKNVGEWDFDILSSFFDVPELKDWGFKEIELDINIDKLDVDKDETYKITVKTSDSIQAKELFDELKQRGFDVKTNG